MVNTVDGHANVTITWENMGAEKGYVDLPTYDMSSIIKGLQDKAAAEGKTHKISLNDIPIDVMWTGLSEGETPETPMRTVGELHAEPGDAPNKICLPIGTVWPSERRSISDTYKKFNDWATGKITSEEFFEFNDNDIAGDSLYTGTNYGIPEGMPLVDSEGKKYHTATDPNDITSSYLDFERMSVQKFEEIETLIWKSEDGVVFDNNSGQVTITANPLTFSAGEKLRIYGTNASGETRITFHYIDTGGGWKEIVSGALNFSTIGYVDIPITAEQATLLTNNGATQYIIAKNCTITKISRVVSSTSN